MRITEKLANLIVANPTMEVLTIIETDIIDNYDKDAMFMSGTINKVYVGKYCNYKMNQKEYKVLEHNKDEIENYLNTIARGTDEEKSRFVQYRMNNIKWKKAIIVIISV